MTIKNNKKKEIIEITLPHQYNLNEAIENQRSKLT